MEIVADSTIIYTWTGNLEKYRDRDKAYIYVIRCLQNGKRYVGVTENPKLRFTEHSYLLKRNKHHNKRLQDDFNKYGDSNFVIEIVDIVGPIQQKSKLKRLRNIMEYNWMLKTGSWNPLYGYNNDPRSKIKRGDDPRKKS